jgi:hypothetical protein
VSKSLYGWVGDSLSNIPHLNYVSCFSIVESPSHVTHQRRIPPNDMVQWSTGHR